MPENPFNGIYDDIIIPFKGIVKCFFKFYFRRGNFLCLTPFHHHGIIVSEKQHVNSL